MRFLLPIISGILYRAGGSNNPYLWKRFFNYRSMIGIPIGLYFTFHLHSWIPLVCILTYWFQPPYGEKSYLNWMTEGGKFAFCGFIMGISSLPVWIAMGHWWIGLIQGIVGALVYLIIKVFDDLGKLKNPWVEFCRGLGGTLCYFYR